VIKPHKLLLILCFMSVWNQSVIANFYRIEIKMVYTDSIAILTRGPYLQIGNTNSIIIRWRTDVPTTSKVTFGPSPTLLNQTVFDSTEVKDHIVRLNGLPNSTKYYYSIGSSIQILQGDANNYFVSPPNSNTIDTVNIWAMGDMGNNSVNQRNVRDRYYSFMGSKYTDLWLLMGDNAYSFGYDAEYQTKFFDIYKDKILKQTLLCPAPGNHDYAGNAILQASHNIPYYDMFSLPTQGEMGGVASGTESYYSFDYSNIHFISLDSYGKDSTIYRLADTLGPQARWLKQDLALNSKEWTILYWHHPPYTMGSHNSDTEAELVNIRNRLLPIIERYNIDLILTGHSHDYERTRLIKGHYGLEPTFQPIVHNIDSSSAIYNGSGNSCPYIKKTGEVSGAIYAVVGSAGQLGATQAAFPHNAMYYSDASVGGALAIEVLQNKLVAKWVCSNGQIRDQFTILKDVNKHIDTTITHGDSLALCASWNGSYNWTNNASTQKCISVQPDSTITYIVTDQFLCLADTFTVHVCYPPSAVNNSSTNAICQNTSSSFTIQSAGSVPINYQWQYSSDNGNTWYIITDSSMYQGIQSPTLTITNSPDSLNGYWYQCGLQNSCGHSTSIPSILTVLPIDTASITIQSTTTYHCDGDTISFTANAINGGNLPYYQWFVNNIAVGNDSAFYQNSSLQNGNSVMCILTSNKQCVFTSTDSSNTINVTIYPYTTPSIQINAIGSTNIIAGDTVFFNASTVNTDSNVHYQWYVNGIAQGTNSPNFFYSSFNDADSVNCLITQPTLCSTIDSLWSKAIYISVQPITEIVEVFEKTSFQINPNPFSNTFDVFIKTKEPGSFRITNQLGIVVYKQKITASTTLKLNADLIGLTKGIYIAELITNTSKNVLKIIKSN